MTTLCLDCHASIARGSRCAACSRQHNAATNTRWRAATGGTGWAWSRVRAFVFAEYDGRCALCGGQGQDVDHIIPVARGGTSDPSNLRLLCARCHVGVTR